MCGFLMERSPRICATVATSLRGGRIMFFLETPSLEMTNSTLMWHALMASRTDNSNIRQQSNLRELDAMGKQRAHGRGKGLFPPMEKRENISTENTEGILPAYLYCKNGNHPASHQAPLGLLGAHAWGDVLFGLVIHHVIALLTTTTECLDIV